MKTNKVVIGMGANVRPYINFAEAIRHLNSYFKICSLSPVGRTKPIGIIEQPDFVNGALLIETTKTFKEVRLILKKIEDDMGRDRTLPKFGPRIIDLDVVKWNNDIVDDDYYTRDFLKKAVDSVQDSN
ncbi:MAG: 2-amino-4-hydroxy-6-hydroxymethyldihydropteridine diphosphokinase [Bacteroidales bacterium]|nr:2-amino-4-hydroxy-6-hydroxymethyldihydropteridine diphosphokinase [Bacteroidales bacterium]